MTATHTPAAPGTVREIDPATAHQWLQSGQAIMVDVREAGEYAAESIPGTQLIPLSAFNPARVEVPPGRKLLLQCRSGMRSRQAAMLLAKAGVPEVWNLAGGIMAWKQAGLPTSLPPAGPKNAAPAGRIIIDVMRQTQLVIGVMVLTGLALGFWVSPWFLLLPTLAGGGLLMAGFTGVCPMANLIATLPWNRSAAAPSACCCGDKSGQGGGSCCGG